MDTQVLVVEDEPDLREALRELLECEGFSCVCATQGAEALALLRDGMHPRIILLDLMMPIVNGWEFLDARNDDPVLRSIPVLVLSAAENELAKLRGVNVLAKPAPLQAILDAIQRCTVRSRERAKPPTGEVA